MTGRPTLFYVTHTHTRRLPGHLSVDFPSPARGLPSQWHPNALTQGCHLLLHWAEHALSRWQGNWKEKKNRESNRGYEAGGRSWEWGGSIGPSRNVHTEPMSLTYNCTVVVDLGLLICEMGPITPSDLVQRHSTFAHTFSHSSPFSSRAHSIWQPGRHGRKKEAHLLPTWLWLEQRIISFPKQRRWWLPSSKKLIGKPVNMKLVHMGFGKGTQACGVLICSCLIHSQPCSVHCLQGTQVTSRFLVWAVRRIRTIYWHLDERNRKRGLSLRVEDRVGRDAIFWICLILVELFQILKDDAVKVLHSICQKIWKMAVATSLEKVSSHSNSKERQCQRMLKLLHNCTCLTC